MRGLASALLVVITLLAASLASGCGFHLRGAYPLPEAMDSTYVEYSGRDTRVRRESVRALSLNGVHIATSIRPGVAILEIQKAVTAREIISRDRNGRPQEYSITVGMRFRVLDHERKVLIESRSVSENAVLALDTTNPAASRSELNIAVSSLQESVVMQMIRAISAADAENGAPETPQ